MNVEEAVKALKSVMCDCIKKKSCTQTSTQTVKPAIQKPTKKELLDFSDDEEDNEEPEGPQSSSAESIFLVRNYLDAKKVERNSDLLKYWDSKIEVYSSLVDCVLEYLCISGIVYRSKECSLSQGTSSLIDEID